MKFDQQQRWARHWNPWRTWAGVGLLLLGMAGVTGAEGEEGSVGAAPGKWQHLFDGQTLAGWREAPFGGRGEVTIEQGEIHLQMGAVLTGLIYTNPVPRMNYEIALEGKRVMGTDFFCGLTVPVGETNCTLILGGWGGGVVGISSLDHYDASENDTTTYRSFEKDRWYDIRLRVTPELLQVWLDDKEVIHASIKDRKVGMRAGEIELCVPLGVATFQTSAALRNIRLRTVTGPAE